MRVAAQITISSVTLLSLGLLASCSITGGARDSHTEDNSRAGTSLAGPAAGESAAAGDQSTAARGSPGDGEDLPAPLPFAETDAEPLDLSLDEALMQALQYNPDIRLRRFDPLIAQSAVDEAEGAFDPLLFLDAEYLQRRQRQRQAQDPLQQWLLPDNDSLLRSLLEEQWQPRRSWRREEGVAVGLGIEQPLASGGSVVLEGMSERRQLSGDGQVYSSGLAASLTQPLLRGAGSQVARAEVRLAQLGLEASRHEFHGYVMHTLANVERAYWELVRRRQAIAAVQASLDVAQQQRDETERRIQRGVLPDSEAAVARTEVALREQALIDAEAALASAELQLWYLLHPQGVTGTRRIDASSSPQPARETPPEAELLQQAQELRPELQEAQLRLAQRRLQTVVSADGVLPQLDIFVSLGASSYASSFRRSIDRVGDERELRLGMRFEQALGDGARSRLRGARFAEDRSAAAIENLRYLIIRDVRLARLEVERSRRQIDATAASSSLRQTILENEQARLRAGTTTGLQVAQAARDALQSQIDEIAAAIDYQQALIDLYLAEGSLLQRRGISLGEIE